MHSFVATDNKKKEKYLTHLSGLEPPTFWLTAKRANPLRHKCLMKETVDETAFLIQSRVY